VTHNASSYLIIPKPCKRGLEIEAFSGVQDAGCCEAVAGFIAGDRLPVDITD